MTIGSHLKNVFPLAIRVALTCLILTSSSCVTSGDVHEGKTEEDPSGIVTVDGTSAAPEPVAAAPVAASKPSADGATLPAAQELAVLRGKLEDNQVTAQREKDALNARIAELEANNKKLQEAGQRTAPVAVATPVATNSHGGASGAPALWQSAQKEMKAGAYDKALTPLQEITKTYPKHELAMPALINCGILQYQLGQYNDAALTFNQAIEKYPKRPETALAWYGQAASFARLKQLEESKLVFEEVVHRYPATVEGKSAKLIVQKKDAVPNSLFSLAAKHHSLRL